MCGLEKLEMLCGASVGTGWWIVCGLCVLGEWHKAASNSVASPCPLPPPQLVPPGALRERRALGQEHPLP